MPKKNGNGDTCKQCSRFGTEKCPFKGLVKDTTKQSSKNCQK